MATYKFEKPKEIEWQIFCGSQPKMKSMDEFFIIADTREATPWLFNRQMSFLTLHAGDYSIGYKIAPLLGDRRKEVSLVNLFAVERKASISDLAACVTTERQRFEEELKKLADLKWRAVICEFSFETFLLEALKFNIAPAALSHSIFSWQFKYKLPWFFCPNAMLAQDCFIFLAREVMKFEVIGKQVKEAF